MRALISRSAFVAVLAAGLFAINFQSAQAQANWSCQKCRCEFPANVCVCEGPCTFW